MARVFRRLADALRQTLSGGRAGPASSGTTTAPEGFVARDHLGNSYFEKPAVSGERRSRWFEPAREGGELDAELPPEWDSWLRYRRPSPPAEGEVERNLRRAAAVRARVHALEEAARGDARKRLAPGDNLVAADKAQGGVGVASEEGVGVDGKEMADTPGGFPRYPELEQYVKEYNKARETREK